MFYHFNQNNIGGYFIFEEKQGLTHHVVIEDFNYEEANSILEEKGGYLQRRKNRMV